MWTETKHGLYKQYNFENFKEAWAFMTQIATLAEAQQHHPRWENEWSVVQIWLLTHEGDEMITDKDRFMATSIDAIYDKKQLPSQPSDVAKVNKVKLFADGGSRGNPGPSASGFVILDMEDKILVDKGVYLGITTNNQAEYTALKLALEECIKMNVHEVQVYMDSMLVVNQMRGIFKIKNRELWPVHDSIKRLADQFKDISFQHVPREFNKLADAAVNRALDDELNLGISEANI
jgi:ribonuclease HI